MGVSEEGGKEDGGGGVKSWGGSYEGWSWLGVGRSWQRRNLKGFIGRSL